MHLLLSLALLGLWWPACSSESDPADSNNGAGAGPASSCPAGKPADGAECSGLLSCSYGEDTCGPGVYGYTYDHCFCEGEAFKCSPAEVLCDPGSGGGGQGGTTTSSGIGGTGVGGNGMGGNGVGGNGVAGNGVAGNGGGDSA